MGKNKLSSGLINVVTYDTENNISLNSGSNLLMSLSGSGKVTIPGNLVVLGGISGSSAESSSYALNADKINNLDSTQLVLTSSFNSYTSSVSSSLGSLSGSVATTTLNLSSSVSSSIGSLSGSIATTTSELSSSIGSLSSSVATTTSGLSSSVATTTSNLSSSVATTTSGLAGRIGTIEGNYATTGSNTFIGSQVITGSLYITTDLIVQGSSSLQNITASAVSIGTNTVILNTDTPAVRFAGISVQDSGSNAGVTGSIFWDGLCNRWVYSNPSGIGYSGGMLLSGPRTSTLGSEAPLTCNYIAKSGGGDHLYDSCIIDDGTTVCVNANLKGSGTLSATTIYGSTAVCSSVGKFTSCIDAGIGTFSGGVSIGTTNTTGKVSIQQTINDSGLYFFNCASGTRFMFNHYCGSGINSLIIQEFDASNTFCRNIIALTSGGNVGIGIANPSSILDIQSAASIIKLKSTTGTNSVYTNYENCSNFYVGTDSTAGGSFGKPCAAVLWQVSCNSIVFATSNTEQMRITGGGNVGIGTSSPLGIINNKGAQIDQGGHTTLMLGSGIINGGVIQSSDESRRIFIGANIYDDVTNSWSQFCDCSGFAALDTLGYPDFGMARILVGKPNQSGYSSDHIFLEAMNCNTSSYLKLRTATDNALYIANNGDIGIGTASPVAKLDIMLSPRTGTHANCGQSLYLTAGMGEGQNGNTVGNIEFRHSNGTQGIGFGYNTIYQTGSNTNEILNLLSRGTGPITLNAYGYSTGNVGIGRCPTANKLEVNGDASKTSAGSWLSNSDINIKTNINTIQCALERINKVRVVSFKYKDEYKKVHTSIKDKYYQNVIAQEYQEIYPNYVYDSGDVFEDYNVLQVDTNPMYVDSVSAIQELSKMVQEQQCTICSQASMINILKSCIGIS
jgi:hypothetical protein